MYVNVVFLLVCCAKLSQGAEYNLPYDFVEFLGFTAPIPQSVKSARVRYFNDGSGLDWISRMPQFFCLNTNLRVFVHEATRVRYNKGLRIGQDALHELVSRETEHFCQSIDLQEKDREFLSRSRSRGLLIVRDIKEISKPYLTFDNTVPALTVLFPLAYHRTKSLCESVADVCIPDNYLIKTIPHDALGACAHSGWWTPRAKYLNIIFPGKIYTRKGQLEFLLHADGALLRRYTLKFYGRVMDEDYNDSVKKVCNDKGLTCEFYGPVSHEELMKSYKNSSGIVSFGVVERDPNPRIVVESFACNKPVLLGPETVTSSTSERHFPAIGRKVRILNETREIFRQWIMRDYGKAPRKFFDAYASEGSVYSHLIGLILEKKYATNWNREYSFSPSQT